MMASGPSLAYSEGKVSRDKKESFMALVKKSALGKRGRSKPPTASPTSAVAGAMVEKPATDAKRPGVRSTRARRGMSALERLDQATQELASGLGQSAAAAAQLQRNVETMSGGAEEAAGAAQESVGLIGHLRSNFREANARAAASQGQTERLQGSLAETAGQIDASVAAITLNAQRQLGSVAIIERLEDAAGRISAVGATVGDLAEQTGMLALNAAIEATRAGDSGKGFAIIADEVRELADGAETNAIDIEAIAQGIVTQISVIADRIRAASTLAEQEAQTGRMISAALASAREDLAIVMSGAQDIAAAAAQAEVAATEAERGAEQVASAAEEQSAAASEAQQAIEQQAASLEESQQTAEALGELSGVLCDGARDTTAIEQVATAAEELSATVQELSGASNQIQIAIEQIARGAQLQSAATIESTTAMGQIEAGAGLARERATQAVERLDGIVGGIADGSAKLDGLVAGMGAAVGETRAVLDLLSALGDTARRAEKITDALALGALQSNMLGVSGAVEATRAGEAGHGFATVTGDIRKLARALAANADDGKDVIRAIQDQLAVIRRDLDQIAAAGEAEAVRNRAVLDRFAAMTEELGATRKDNGAILEGAEAIQRAAREVKSGCDQIAKAAELASDAAREAGAAAAQQAQGAESLAAAIEDIASLAASLNVTGEQAAT